MEALYESFDEVFTDTVKENHLIHGDYNLWNLIADPKTNKLIGMIDPFGSCFADRELELFSLQMQTEKSIGCLKTMLRIFL